MNVFVVPCFSKKKIVVGVPDKHQSEYKYFIYTSDYFKENSDYRRKTTKCAHHDLLYFQKSIVSQVDELGVRVGTSYRFGCCFCEPIVGRSREPGRHKSKKKLLEN